MSKTFFVKRISAERNTLKLYMPPEIESLLHWVKDDHIRLDFDEVNRKVILSKIE